jgi:SAM-dependent methyltransferase
MKPLALEYISLVQAEIEANNVIRNDPQIPFFSTVTEGVIDRSKMLGPEYWADNLTSPVRFHAAVSKLLSQESRNVFLEIGPHSTLAGPLREICAEARTPCLYIPTMLRSNHCVESLLSAIGQLYQQGIAVKFESLTPVANVLSDLPPYPWDHTVSHWYESRLSRDWRFRSVGHHALLGQQIPEGTSLDPCWRVVLDLEDEPWLYDHKVRDDVVFPFAGYVAMAGEAIRQITGIELGYSVRHVVAHTALVLTESKPVEVVTTLRRHKLTDSTDSDFYHFVISSYSGSAWINNCEGRVRANEKAPESSSQSDVLPRKVLPSRWYEIMARVGLVYGPEFQGITALSSSATTKLAAADITNSTARQEAPYLFHPAAIDACLQLALAALAQGAGRNFTQLCVPTLIEELDISRSALNMKAKAWSSNDGKDIGIDCVADGKIALRLRGARLSPLEDDKAIVSADRHAAARLEWCPDFDFIDIPPLFSPPVADNDIKQLLEEMALLCLLESAERLKDLSTEQPHFEKFRDWLQREIRRAESGTYPIVQEAATYVKLPRSERLKMIQQRYQALSSTPSIGLVATGIMRICENAEGLFTGNVDTLDLLMQDNVLTEIYNAVSFGFGDFVRMLANTKPNLRILEVGAGTGGTTELILQDLVSSGGNPSYSVYTFTDISAGFFPQARERFAYAPNMDYKVFDISQSPFEQGFEAASYDLILAPNVVHATPNLQDTLRNLRPLLRPHGHLVLSEVCAVARAPGYVFGNFSGWWLGEADDRRYEPYVNVDRWDRELRAAGFTGVDTAVLDAEEPYQYCAAIVTQPEPQESEADNRSITVLCEQQEQGISQSLIFYFKQAGFAVSIVKFGEPLPQDQDIISTLDLETPFFENITKERFSAFQQLLRHHKSQKLLWLMPPTQVRCLDPHSAQTIGMFRVVRAELAIPFMTLEIDPTETDFFNLVMKVFHKVRTREDTDKIAPDKEFAVDRGVIKIGRYEPFSLEKEVCEKSAIHLNHVVKMLEIAKPGLLETLRWTEGSIPSIIKNYQVEIETRAVGLNFRVCVEVMPLPYLLKLTKIGYYGLYGSSVLRLEESSSWSRGSGRRSKNRFKCASCGCRRPSLRRCN